MIPRNLCPSLVEKRRRESVAVGFTDAVKRRGGKGSAKASIKACVDGLAEAQG